MRLGRRASNHGALGRGCTTEQGQGVLASGDSSGSR